MKHSVKVLVVTPDRSLEEMFVDLVLKAGCEVAHVHDADGALRDWGAHRAPDFTVVDGRMPATELRDLLQGLDRTHTRVVLLSDDATPEPLRKHHAVVRLLPEPWTVQTVMKLIDWMDGDDPNALRGSRSPEARP